jgi:hypothetical protein
MGSSYSQEVRDAAAILILGRLNDAIERAGGDRKKVCGGKVCAEYFQVLRLDSETHIPLGISSKKMEAIWLYAKNQVEAKASLAVSPPRSARN